MVTRRDSEPGNKNIPLGLELHTFFNLQRSTTTYSIGKEGEHNVVTRLYTHLAKSDEDFNEIFDREISRKVKKEELDDDEVTRDLFRRTLYDIVRIYLVRYREFTSLYPDRRSLRKEKAAELFLVWLTAKKTTSELNASSVIETGIKEWKNIDHHALYAVWMDMADPGSKNSKLSKRFAFYRKPVNRTGIPLNTSDTKFKNIVVMYEAVIKMLPPERQSRPLSEFDIFKNNYYSKSGS